MRPSRDKKGALVGSEALGPYGTPKCEFIMQLLRVEEPENERAGLGGVWIGSPNAGPSPSPNPNPSPKQARGALAAGSVALWEVEASAGEGWRAPAAVRQIEQVSSS